MTSAEYSEPITPAWIDQLERNVTPPNGWNPTPQEEWIMRVIPVLRAAVEYKSAFEAIARFPGIDDSSAVDAAMRKRNALFEALQGTAGEEGG